MDKEKLITYLKERKKYLEDFSGCGSDYELRTQTGRLEEVEEILEHVKENM